MARRVYRRKRRTYVVRTCLKTTGENDDLTNGIDDVLSDHGTQKKKINK